MKSGKKGEGEALQEANVIRREKKCRSVGMSVKGFGSKRENMTEKSAVCREWTEYILSSKSNSTSLPRSRGCLWSFSLIFFTLREAVYAKMRMCLTFIMSQLRKNVAQSIFFENMLLKNSF